MYFSLYFVGVKYFRESNPQELACEFGSTMKGRNEVNDERTSEVAVRLWPSGKPFNIIFNLALNRLAVTVWAKSL